MPSKVANGPLTFDDSGGSDSLRKFGAAAALLALLLVLAALWMPRWRTYPAATSRESLDLIKGLYSACSAQNEQWLDRIEEEVTESSERGGMSKREHEAFTRIINSARAGQWDAAQQASLRFAEDQIRR